jgi:hypothetical protein
MNDTPSNAETPVPVAPAELPHLYLLHVVLAQALAWTKRAVRVRFGALAYQHEVWVSAGAVRVLTGDTADSGRPAAK